MFDFSDIILPSSTTENNSLNNLETKTPKFLRSINKPWLILAPMVDYSDEPFRKLVTNNGAHFAYTEMVNTKIADPSKFNPKNNQWYTNIKNVHPFVIQINGNNPEKMLEICKPLEPYCDAIDINLGCPQCCAKRGGYGAYLMNDLDLVKNMIKKLSNTLKVPVFCKIRVYQSIEKTVEYAKLLENAGCSLLTVHGRTVDQKGQNTGYVSLEHIKAVKEALSIPVISNGGIINHEGIASTLEFTKCDGVMIAEPALSNPGIFSSNENKTIIDYAREYIAIIEDPEFCENGHFLVRRHFYKIFHHILAENKEFYAEINKINNIDQCKSFVDKISEMYNDDPNFLKAKHIKRSFYN